MSVKKNELKAYLVVVPLLVLASAAFLYYDGVTGENAGSVLSGWIIFIYFSTRTRRPKGE